MLDADFREATRHWLATKDASETTRIATLRERVVHGASPAEALWALHRLARKAADTGARIRKRDLLQFLAARTRHGPNLAVQEGAGVVVRWIYGGWAQGFDAAGRELVLKVIVKELALVVVGVAIVGAPQPWRFWPSLRVFADGSSYREWALDLTKADRVWFSTDLAAELRPAPIPREPSREEVERATRAAADNPYRHAFPGGGT